MCEMICWFAELLAIQEMTDTIILQVIIIMDRSYIVQISVELKLIALIHKPIIYNHTHTDNMVKPFLTLTP